MTASRRSALALMLIGSTAMAAPPLAFRREIVRPGAGDAVLVVPIDPTIYEATRDGFPDLRILDDRGAEVPFAVEPVVRTGSRLVREPVAAAVESLRVSEGGAIEVVAALEADAPEPDGATIQTPLVDFERKVAVFGAAGDGSWKALGEGRIYDYSRYMDVRGVEVAFQPHGSRRLKLVIDREADELHSPFYELSRSRIEGDRERRTEVEGILRRPFRIDRIAFHRDATQPSGEEPATQKVPLEVVGVEVDRERQETRIDVEARRLPLRRLTVRTTSRNFHRPAQVLEEVDGRWAEAGRGTLSLYRFDGFRREEVTLELDGRRADRLRIVVKDGDSPPLEVAGVDGEFAEHRLAFLAEPGRAYALAYGSPDAPAPRYDAAEVLAALGPDTRREAARLREPRADPAYRPAPPPGRGWSASPFWVLLALALMAGVLLWALVQAANRGEKPKAGEFD